MFIFYVKYKNIKSWYKICMHFDLLQVILNGINIILIQHNTFIPLQSHSYYIKIAFLKLITQNSNVSQH